MYTVTVTNNSGVELTASDGSPITAGGGTWTTENTTGWIDTALFGRLGFLDIGDQHIPGDTGETWGSLIIYRYEAVVGRYEGGGQLKVVFDQFLSVTVDGMDFRMVQLDPIDFAGHT